jgi:transcriptional regulator with XRE-family HTH domain
MSTDAAVSADLTDLVAAEIRALMGRRNINRAELARRLNVEDSWVGKRLNGRTEIGVNDLPRIAEALGVGIVDLLPRSERRLTGDYPPEGDKPGEAVKIPQQRNPYGKSRPAGRSDSRHPAGRPERRTSPTRRVS